MSEKRLGSPDLPVGDDLCLTDVLGACVAALDAGLPSADDTARRRFEIEPAPQMLVLLVDGLGWMPLESRFGHAPTLRSHREDTMVIHTVVPSTTAAAITSFATGALPGATRMVGYSVFLDDRVMNLLAFADGIDPAAWQPVDTIFERVGRVGVDSAAVVAPTFVGSGLTRAALRGARHVGAVSWPHRIEAALRELRAGTPLVYLYWSDIDHAGHAHGVGSEEWTTALEEFDAGLSMLLRRLPRGVGCVLTADHGMVDTAPAHLIDLAETPALAEGVEAIAGETRSVHVHAQPGRADAVLDRWREILADRVWIFSRDELPGIVGDGPGASIVGDGLVLMGRRDGIVDSRVQSARSIAQVGVHGSATVDEMRIPVMRLA